MVTDPTSAFVLFSQMARAVPTSLQSSMLTSKSTLLSISFTFSMSSSPKLLSTKSHPRSRRHTSVATTTGDDDGPANDDDDLHITLLLVVVLLPLPLV